MKLVITNFMLACVACIGAGGAYLVWNHTIGTAIDRVGALDTEIATKTATVARIASARASLTEIAADEATMRSYFVPEANAVSLITDLESKGRPQGATVKVTNIAPSGSGARAALALTITVKGSFDGVMRTLGTIEYAPYAISLTSLSLNSDDKQNWSATASLTVGSVSATAAAASSPATP